MEYVDLFLTAFKYQPQQLEENTYFKTMKYLRHESECQILHRGNKLSAVDGTNSREWLHWLHEEKLQWGYATAKNAKSHPHHSLWMEITENVSPKPFSF